MKQLFLLPAFLLFSHTVVFSQGCLPEGISFTLQEQIDNFQTNYPGCTEIEGDVEIYDYWGTITNLNGLSVLNSIGGYLVIYETFTLSNLSGLENLTTIGAAFQIYLNQALTNLTGLENLSSIGGDFIINDSPLNSLSGLEGLTSIGGDLFIDTSTLTDLAGLNNLLTIGWNLTISYNPLLTSLNGLNELNSIGGDIDIHNNNALLSLMGIDNIEANSISNLSIYYNSELNNCDVQSICNYLSNPIGIIKIHSNSEGCNNIPEIASNCGISLPCLPYGNYYLFTQADVDNFHLNYPECEDLNGNISIFGNNIINLLGLNQITTVSGSVFILGENPNMTNLDGLNNLLLIGEGLSIYSNSALTNLSGLNSLYSIGGSLKIVNNDMLQNLNGLDALNLVGGLVQFHGNASLTNIADLHGLTSIGGDIQFSSNPALMSLNGLDNIAAATIANISIANNNLLEDCDVQSICAFLINPNGNVSIYNNATGCNSPEEVEEHCLTSVAENSDKETVTLFPNPATSFITINIKEGIPIEAAIIYNHLGQKALVAVPENNTVDVSTLTPGMYILEVVTENRTIREILLVE